VHEMSVALEVCRMAEERLDASQLGQLVGVGLEVGDEAGLEPENLTFCLETLLSQPPFAGALPVIVRVKGDVLRLDYLEVDDGRPGD
jgi:Zn finger protein HypA/HybF involved in hydrogenase expression